MDRGLDRRPGGKDEHMPDDQALRVTETYVHACLMIIELTPGTLEDLREWFREERDERFERYGLSENQKRRIVMACQDQAERLKSRG